MSNDIDSLIDAINDKNFTDANSAFSDILNQKLGDALDQERVVVASQVHDKFDYGDDIEDALEDQDDDDQDV